MSCQFEFQEIKTALENGAKEYPSFSYPWEGLEDWLEKSDLPELPLVGYGSLINQQSAGRTINVDSSARRQAVKAFGAKRIFNYRMPDTLLKKRYQTPPHPRKVAALNCETSGLADDEFNGILTYVKGDRLSHLREREKSYSLKPIAYHNWDGDNTPLRVAYILELLPDPSIKDHPYDSTILPHQKYTELCQEGARCVSPSFLEHFNKTCLLSDKKTTLAAYQSKHGKPEESP